MESVWPTIVFIILLLFKSKNFNWLSSVPTMANLFNSETIILLAYWSKIFLFSSDLYWSTYFSYAKFASNIDKKGS